MKYNFTLLCLLLLSLTTTAQNVTGIWKGYFVQNNFGFYEDRYRFEVQVEQLPNNALNGVTYSYKTTVFYGKAEAKGIYTKSTKNVLINELKLVDLKIGDKSEPCLMTCYLEYDRMGNIETLTGTYSSRNVKDKSDCGSGKVYLEKTTTSDFYKEEFLVKREKELSKRKPITKKPATASKVTPKTSSKTTARSTVPKKPLVKPGAEDNLISKNDKPEKKQVTPPPAPSTASEPKKDEPIKPVPPPVAIKKLPAPEVLKTRSNELVQTIPTSAKEFKIELYDNGEIDGDRISVYHNNELIVSNKQLTDKPISFNIKADANAPMHEFVMVAENLGSIPPNTALMIITAGGKRYELHITSTVQKNAVVRIEYRPE